jgi:hypothetical protein
MLRQLERMETAMLVEKVAGALGNTADEIWHSERFEQTVYDFAKSYAKLPEQNFTGNAHFSINTQTSPKRIKIEYETHNGSTQALAEFYHKFFPETQPQYIYGLEQSITFAMDPFIQKVLPTMKLWRTRPSCITENNLHYVDSSNMRLKSSLNPGFENAVFITGADKLLGGWEMAIRLTFNKSSQGWEFKLPGGTLKENEFKFLTGAFNLGETVEVSKLSYETGDNRTLIIHAPLSTCNKPQQDRPVGYGVRC